MPSSRPSSFGWAGTRWTIIGAVGLPLAAALAWIPLRAQWPNVDLALVLVLVVTACGLTGRASNVVASAASAAGSFAFFDTRPYEHWVVARQPDLETLVVLAAVSLVTGLLAVRTVGLRSSGAPAANGMTDVRELAALVASGAELVAVITSGGECLLALLDGSAWSYEAGAAADDAAVVGRDGAISAHDAAGRAARFPRDVEVPVSGMGKVLGRYRIEGAGEASSDTTKLLVALTLADQVGAALIAQAPETSEVAEDPGTAVAARGPDTPPVPSLRLLK